MESLQRQEPEAPARMSRRGKSASLLGGIVSSILSACQHSAPDPSRNRKPVSRPKANTHFSVPRTSRSRRLNRRSAAEDWNVTTFRVDSWCCFRSMLYRSSKGPRRPSLFATSPRTRRNDLSGVRAVPGVHAAGADHLAADFERRSTADVTNGDLRGGSESPAVRLRLESPGVPWGRFGHVGLLEPGRAT